MSKNKHLSEAEGNPVATETVELSRRALKEEKEADLKQAKADAEAKAVAEYELNKAKEQEEKAKADKELADAEAKKQRLEGYTHLTPGQRITARGRIIAGMSIEDAVAFATKPKPFGRSAAAEAIRAKHPRKFGIKLGADGKPKARSEAAIKIREEHQKKMAELAGKK